MRNQEIADRLKKIADLMEIKGIDWKPRAYRNAARSIENQKDDLQDLYDKRGKKGLEEIKSIGKSLAQHIADMLDGKKISKWNKLEKNLGKYISELINIDGLGPKKIHILIKKLNIKNVEDLKKKAEKNKISELEGFGEQTEQNILESLEEYRKGKERMLINKANALSEDILGYFKKDKNIQKIEISGSLRRMKETIGDIDILAISNNEEETMKKFRNMSRVSKVVVKGKKKTSVIFDKKIQVDLRLISKDSFGSALQYFTGSKAHNIALRKIASKKNYKLSEYGLYSTKNNKKVSGKTEKEVYKKLGLTWIPPELREDNGEIEAAQKNNLPRLIEKNDIKGDLQMHSTYSDGKTKIKGLVKKAEELGYTYIAITDHSQSQRIAKGMSAKKIKKQWKEIDNINKNSNIKILKGAEVDILKDGTLDYDKKTLQELDIVLASVHSGFKMSKNKMTERILKALDNNYINILAHPTGRMIGKRKGYDADFDKIFKKCKQKNIAVEINSDPERLDLNEKLILKAKKENVKFSIGTDAHSKYSLENIKYGLGMARRGWLQKKDIINTKTYEQLIKFLS